jgi:hypothetical protein
MLAACLVSLILGLGWTILVAALGGAKPSLIPGVFWPAGMMTGLVAGLYTVWSRRRLNGEESVIHGIATYYLAILMYSSSTILFGFFQQFWQTGDTAVLEPRNLRFWFTVHFLWGTFPFGLLLIPLTFLSRYVVWKSYTRA